MATRRQRMIALLSDGPLTVRELSDLLQVPIALVVDDLTHVRRSVGQAFRVAPPACLSCGFELSRRERFTAPSRCPRCKSERTTEPLLRIEG